MNNVYGATHKEKKGSMHGYYLGRYRFLQMEKRWYHQVIQDMKKWGLIHYTFFHIVDRVLMITIVGGLVLAYFTGSTPGFGILLYVAVSCYLLIKFPKIEEGRSQMFLFLAISLLYVIFLIDSNLILPYLLFILSGSLLFVAFPRLLLSKKAAQIRSEIKMFRKQLKQEGIPSVEDGAQLDRQVGLALIFGVREFPIPSMQSEDWMKTAPLSTFIHSEGNPMDYLFETWKLSKPPFGYFKTDKSTGKDGSSSADGGSGGGSGGGDSGGGAGAD
ncbi:hypothetical protein [Fredinandcohnia quinoae]|uniref:Uncharacterized protein n=1 Tax=Fredinandcohnia quinoae TaxID=2918902 RepID=A0AAW5ECV9_9BACI|nr:hypothetical protein [Fredinandcohnia sp. SECRCQ15]MCH1627742.1 hypothetical protein [Fredinandcohnia sp. SECRCQ15]